MRIGYESGAALFNRLGLSTLLPRKVEITTNQYKATLPDGCGYGQELEISPIY